MCSNWSFVPSFVSAWLTKNLTCLSTSYPHDDDDHRPSTLNREHRLRSRSRYLCPADAKLILIR